jgi:hypothetical protein
LNARKLNFDFDEDKAMQTAIEKERGLDPDRYRANTKKWQVGDLVIHSSDDKHWTMLMRVVGYTKDGLAKTRYIHAEYRSGMNIKSTKKIWKNDVQWLFDPKKFGIELSGH